MTASIYTIPLPEATTPTERGSLATRLSEQGVLSGDAVVDAVTQNAADLTLTGKWSYGQYFAELVGAELEELADSSLAGLSLYGGEAARRGYYEIASADVEPVHAGGRDIVEWDLSLTRTGTRSDQWVAVDVQQKQVDHPFGNDTDATVRLPTTAQRVQAVDVTGAPSSREELSPAATVAGAYADVDEYPLGGIGISNPIILYSVPHADAPAVDVHVSDDRGRDNKFVYDSSGRARVFQNVFATDHEFDGGVVLESGRLAVRIDPTARTLAAGAWDGSATPANDGLLGFAVSDPGAYVDVGLPASDWEPVDVDLLTIGQARAVARTTFENVTSGATYVVDLELTRGAADALVSVPALAEQGTMPSGLDSLLSPIASTSVVSTQAEHRLVARSEVRR